MQDWASGAWAGEVPALGDVPPTPVTGQDPTSGTADRPTPTPTPGVPIADAPVPPQSDPGGHRPRHMLLSEDPAEGTQEPAPQREQRPSPQPRAQPRPPGSLADRLSPTEQDLLQRLHEELAARETGGEPTPRNGSARTDPN